jgi:hypothetical protein
MVKSIKELIDARENAKKIVKEKFNKEHPSEPQLPLTDDGKMKILKDNSLDENMTGDDMNEKDPNKELSADTYTDVDLSSDNSELSPTSMANNKQKEDVLDETIKQFKETNWTEFILPDGSKYWWNTMNNKTTRVNPFEKAEMAQELSSSSSTNEQKTDSLLQRDNSQIEISDNTTNESEEK